MYVGGKLTIFDIPMREIKKNRKTKTVLDFPAMIDLARTLADIWPDVTVLFEEVGGSKKQGSSGAFTFGKTTGATEMALRCAGFRVVNVPPTKWKAGARLIGAGDTYKERKTASRHKAADLWPEHAAKFTRERDDGRAEAALIARFGAC